MERVECHTWNVDNTLKLKNKEMTKIRLNVLDEYARRLSPKQIKMLKENKQGKTGIYEKILNEYVPVYDNSLSCITIDITDIEYQSGKDINDFIATLDYEHPELENVQCTIGTDTVEFCANKADYDVLLNVLASYDIEIDNLNA